MSARDDLICGLLDVTRSKSPADDDWLPFTDLYELVVDALVFNRDLVMAFFDELTELAMTESDAAYAVNEPEPEYEEDPCPHCGGEPGQSEEHADGCETLGTCAQCYPDTPKPWHPESEWWPKGINYGAALDAHMREAHKS